jgi:hypothetical protein
MVSVQVLRDISGVGSVWIDPPPSTELVYPAILLETDRGDTKFADDKPYVFFQGYSLKVISYDQDATVLDAVKNLPRCVYNRHYVADNLHHDVFTIF